MKLSLRSTATNATTELQVNDSCTLQELHDALCSSRPSPPPDFTLSLHGRDYHHCLAFQNDTLRSLSPTSGDLLYFCCSPSSSKRKFIEEGENPGDTVRGTDWTVHGGKRRTMSFMPDLSGKYWKRVEVWEFRTVVQNPNPLLTDHQREEKKEKRDLGDHPPCLIMCLPADLKLKILESLDGFGVAMMACVCVEMRRLSSDNDLWKRKTLEELRLVNDEVEDPSGVKIINWKKRFISRWAVRKRRCFLVQDSLRAWKITDKI